MTCHKSRLWHSGAVAERAYEVLVDHVGCVRATQEGDKSVQTIFLRLDRDEVQVSLDAGGARMHQRGYRKHVARASLRETLAFAICDELLRSSGGEIDAVWDPFCGAGTIPLELLHMKSGRLAGERRRLALEDWRGFDRGSLDSAKDRARSRLALAHVDRAASVGQIFASDSSDSAMKAVSDNLTDGEFSGLSLHRGDVLDVASAIPQGAAVLCNPPYGKRLADCSGVRRLLQLLELRPDLRPVGALVGGAARELIPNSAPAGLKFKNGGMSVSLRWLVS